YMLAERCEALMPADLRFETLTWMFAALNSVEPPLWNLFVLDKLRGDEEWAKLRRAGAVEEVEARLAALSDWLDGRIHLLGSFTAADILMTTVLRFIRHTDLVAGYPVVDAYVKRCNRGRHSRPPCRTSYPATHGTSQSPPDRKRNPQRGSGRTNTSPEWSASIPGMALVVTWPSRVVVKHDRDGRTMRMTPSTTLWPRPTSVPPHAPRWPERRLLHVTAKVLLVLPAVFARGSQHSPNGFDDFARIGCVSHRRAYLRCSPDAFVTNS